MSPSEKPLHIYIPVRLWDLKGASASLLWLLKEICLPPSFIFSSSRKTLLIETPAPRSLRFFTRMPGHVTLNDLAYNTGSHGVDG